MPIDANGLFEAISNGLSKVPSALIAAVLLGGPTAIWLIARFTNPSDIGKREEAVLEDLLWVCANCRSINEDRLHSCYRCHMARSGESTPFVIAVGRERPPGIGIAVGPGLPHERSAAEWLEAELAMASLRAVSIEREADIRFEIEPQSEIEPEHQGEPELQPEIEPEDEASMPAVFEPVILEPRMKVSSRPSAPAPAGRRARREPRATGETKSKRNPRRSGS